ncbi:MAG: SdrD B-like domain-containing protein, partial [Phycicoccus sp.]
GDRNGNGTLEPDETFTATTDTNGYYQFVGLPLNTPGNTPITYTVAVDPATLPPGVTQTFDPDGTPDNTSTTVLNAGNVSDQTRDFGYRGVGSIGDRIWFDVNGNNTFDPGEGIVGVQVTLVGDFDNSGDPETVTATTDANGFYQFTGLVVDDGTGGGKTYTVDVDETTLPSTVSTTPVVDPDGPLDGTAASTLTTPAPTDPTRDFAYRGPGRIGDTVWVDVNGNGTFDAGEGIAGVVVTLTGDLDGNGTTETVTATTTADGQYLFAGLRVTPGGVTYTVTVDTATLPPAVAQFFDPDGTADNASASTLTTTTPTDPTRDFGYRGPGRIGDRVFNDINTNGAYDPGEGLDGVAVTLTGDFDNDGLTETVTTTTTADGLYQFTGLVVDGDNGPGVTPKTYTVSVVPATLPPTLAQSFDPDGTLDNQAAGTLSPSQLEDVTRDFGYRGPGRVGDTVFLDVNGDGLPSRGEGIGGVRVRLIGDFDNDGTAETVTATTDTNGQYLFGGLRVDLAGVPYTVDVDETTLPASVNTTPVVDPDGPLDGTATATLTTAAPTDLTRDFGYRGVGSIGDTVFLDVDNDGLPGASEGLAGVRVFLAGDLDGDGAIETVTATTDANGQYLFGGLRTTPGGVPYTVTVDTATLPQVNGQPPANTVDPDGGNNSTSVVNLTDSPPNNPTQDFGYRNTNSGSIGDTVFLDVDGDGTADAGEGISGVTVTLTADVDGDGTPETFTRTTDANGHYRFDGLPFTEPDGGTITYTVAVNTGALPLAVTNTTDPDGGTPNTSTLTLSPANPDNLAQDFGYRGPGSLGDRVFLDLDGDGRYDAGEGISGATVVLTADVNGDGIRDLTVTATTGADGEYLFGNLPVTGASEAPVAYTVTVTGGLPTGVANTTDPDGTTDGSWTGTLATGPGAPDRRDIDFGYRGTAALGDRIWLDRDGDGVQGAAGE